jgi:hypothetical protein
MVNDDSLLKNDLLKVLAWVRDPTEKNLRRAKGLLVALAGKDELPAKEVTIKGIIIPDDIAATMTGIWKKRNK